MDTTSSPLSLTAGNDSLGNNSFEHEQILRTILLIIGTVINPLICLSGVITNIFNLIILRTEEDTSGNNISLINLAMAEIFFSVLTAFAQLEFTQQDSYMEQTYYKVQIAFNVLGLIPYQAIFFFMSKITVERFISMKLPLKSKQFLTVKNSRNISFVLWILALLTPAIFFVQLTFPPTLLVVEESAHENISNVTTLDIARNSEIEFQIYMNLVLFFYFISFLTPLRMLIVGVTVFCTVSLVFVLRRQNVKRKTLTGDSIGQALSKSERKVARIAVGLGCTLILYSANAIFYVLFLIICYWMQICRIWFSNFVDKLAGLTSICNCSVSFFLYMSLNQTFRIKFYSLFSQMPQRERTRRGTVGIQ